MRKSNVLYNLKQVLKHDKKTTHFLTKNHMFTYALSFFFNILKGVKSMIRPLITSEIPHLETFLYEAIFQKEGQKKLPKDIIFEPTLYNYIKDFGKEDDHCLVEVMDNQLVGAVWTRILGGEPKGFGHIDNETPEFAISVLPGYRGQGIGKRLMEGMIQLLRDKGYQQTSLAVQKENYAAKLYQKVGFKIIKETDEEYVMTLALQEGSHANKDL